MALSAALGICDIPIIGFSAFISAVAMESTPVLTGSLCAGVGCVGIAFLGQLPTLIKSVSETKELLIQAELDVEKDLVSENLSSKKGLAIFKRRNKIQEKTSSLFAEIREANNILKDQNTSLASENVALKQEKEQLTEELGICEDLKEAREEIGVYYDIRAQKQELAARLLWLKEQMDNRYSIKGLSVCEYITNDGTKSVGLFSYAVYRFNRLFSPEFIGFAGLYDKNLQGFDRLFYYGLARENLIHRHIMVSDVLQHMGWNNILALGTISDAELSAVIEYVLNHKEQYGFTFKGIIDKKNIEPNSFNGLLGEVQTLRRKLDQPTTTSIGQSQETNSY